MADDIDAIRDRDGNDAEGFAADLQHYDLDDTYQTHLDRHALLAALDEVQNALDKTLSGEGICCAYCGKWYSVEPVEGDSLPEKLRQHLENCPKHPMAQLKLERDEADKLCAAAEAYCQLTDNHGGDLFAAVKAYQAATGNRGEK